MKFTFSLFAAALALGGAWASNVVELDPDNFDNVVGQGKPALVEFFAPWCGHCKNLAPTYEQLADAFAHAKDKVVVAKVDADGAGRPLGQKYGVTGFPTLQWFDPSGEPEKYEGARDLDALANFITQKSGVKSSIKPPPPPAYQVLDINTFDDVVLNSDKDVLVSFTAPWCGHCKHLKPTYDDVAKDFASESNQCLVANVDADAANNKPLANKYGIQSYPTIKFFPKDAKDAPEDYEGGRTEEAFVEFLNEKCGTQRAPGGGLTDLAGRLPEFDTLASQFYAATGAARDAIYRDASALAAAAGPAAHHYVRVMEKVVNGSEEYVEREAKRLAALLRKRTLAPQKLDEMKIKANVLSAFRNVEETVGRITAEL